METTSVALPIYQRLVTNLQVTSLPKLGHQTWSSISSSRHKPGGDHKSVVDPQEEHNWRPSTRRGWNRDEQRCHHPQQLARHYSHQRELRNPKNCKPSIVISYYSKPESCKEKTITLSTYKSCYFYICTNQTSPLTHW